MVQGWLKQIANAKTIKVTLTLYIEESNRGLRAVSKIGGIGAIFCLQPGAHPAKTEVPMW